MTRMSRTVGLVLLGGAALSTCCCLIRPPAPPPPQQYDENGNPIPQATTTSTATGGYRRSSGGMFWAPWLWSGRSYSGSSYRPGPSSFSRSAPAAPGGSVSRGGFGGGGSSAS